MYLLWYQGAVAPVIRIQLFRLNLVPNQSIRGGGKLDPTFSFKKSDLVPELWYYYRHLIFFLKWTKMKDEKKFNDTLQHTIQLLPCMQTTNRDIKQPGCSNNFCEPKINKLYYLGKPQNKIFFLVARPLRKNNFFEAQKINSDKKMWPLSSREVRVLVVGPLKKFFCGFPK